MRFRVAVISAHCLIEVARSLQLVLGAGSVQGNSPLLVLHIENAMGFVMARCVVHQVVSSGDLKAVIAAVVVAVLRLQVEAAARIMAVKGPAGTERPLGLGGVLRLQRVGSSVFVQLGLGATLALVGAVEGRALNSVGFAGITALIVLTARSEMGRPNGLTLALL